MESIKRQADTEAIIKSNQTLANALLHSQTQIQVYHLQTRSYSNIKH